jgi:hypothetical protein
MQIRELARGVSDQKKEGGNELLYATGKAIGCNQCLLHQAYR